MNQPFIKTEKIRFKHVDYAGIVFYPRFLEMLNDLVEDWFEEVIKNDQKIGFSLQRQTTLEMSGTHWSRSMMVGPLLTDCCTISTCY